MRLLFARVAENFSATNFLIENGIVSFYHVHFFVFGCIFLKMVASKTCAESSPGLQSRAGHTISCAGEARTSLDPRGQLARRERPGLLFHVEEGSCRRGRRRGHRTKIIQAQHKGWTNFPTLSKRFQMFPCASHCM